MRDEGDVKRGGERWGHGDHQRTTVFQLRRYPVSQPDAHRSMPHPSVKHIQRHFQITPPAHQIMRKETSKGS